MAYFGYRLFFAVPQQSESGGKIETPGLTITLTRIGPGTFFAICAAGIVIASFAYPIEIRKEGVIGSTGKVSEVEAERRTSIASEVKAVKTAAIDADASHVRAALLHLACIRDASRLKDDERTAIDQARVALMLRLWREKWGEFEAFETWALERRGAPPVTAIAEIFSRKDPRCAN
ncbi:MAG: hypothetical protein OES38_00035 [Gammaproteobacteria bacterium]|nr:hypothetical protein [Gammaproteobacteria bacterium]